MNFVRPIQLFIIISFIFINAISPNEVKNTLNLNFKKIPTGSFTLENSYLIALKEDVNPKVNIKISEFSISQNPITRKNWEDLMGKIKFAPWGDDEVCPDCPAYKLKYSDIKEFISRLSMTDTKKENSYRLPTTSEIIYLATLCEKKNCSEVKNLGSNFQLNFSETYKNKFGFNFEYLNSDYIQTDDFPGTRFLESSNLKQKEIKDPRQVPEKRFNYGRILVGFQVSEDMIFIHPLGFTINMLPDTGKVFFYIVKNK